MSLLFFKKFLGKIHACTLGEEEPVPHGLNELLATTYPRTGGEPIKLGNGIVALYFPPGSDESNNALLCWLIGRYRYEVSMFNESKEKMVEAVNLAILDAQ